MRKTIAAASIAIGGFGVLGLGAAAIAGAQDDPSDDERGGWVQDALSGLVENGTITEEQADAVEEALEDARPDRGFEGGIGHRGFAFGFGGISTVAESLGIGEDELRGALASGQTIADVAEEQGVDVQDVVDDIVAAQRERLDEAVAEGHLTQEEADEFLAGAEERVTAFVNGEPPDREDLPDLRELPHFGDRGPGDGEASPWADGPPWDDDSSEDGAA
jgi:polyhydroxyalkanoate synthesis regulator phasin